MTHVLFPMLWLHKQFSVSSCRLLYMPIIISMVVLYLVTDDRLSCIMLIEILLDTDTQQILNINVHRGHRHTHLSFSVSSEPSIFQKTMDIIFQGMEATICYLNDILVSGKSKTNHLHNPGKVFQKLQAQCIRIVMNCLTLYCFVFTYVYSSRVCGFT